MKSIASALLASVLVALPLSAQSNCSTLSVTTVVDPVLPTQTVTIDISGSPANDPVFLCVGPTLGKTTITLRPGAFVLGLERPFTTTLLGRADSNGALTRSFTIRSDRNLTLNAQAVGVDLTTNRESKPTTIFCTSNVVTIEL